MHRDRLAAEILRLEKTDPIPLLAHPLVDEIDLRAGPVRLRLAAWAVGVAAGLHDDFDDDVELVVGFLRFPGARRFFYPGFGLRPPQHYPTVDPDEIGMALRRPLVVASGHDAWGTVGIHNRSGRRLDLATGTQLTGRVVDPRTGDGVGASTVTRVVQQSVVSLDPGASAALQLWVGTASIDPEIGYAVPAGVWQVDALLSLGDGRILRTPPLPLTVT